VFAALGVLLSCTVLELAGAASTSIVLDPDNPTGAFTQPLGAVVRDLTLLAIALGAVAANSVNIYSGALSFTATGFPSRCVLPGRSPPSSSASSG
jgi:NCS1 family nucleobase:cation symporter-1